ncbi:MAG: hypothetical protein IJ746_06045 [Ruminococcus sp.]|nr:hypothetical protein [Ruminococcus sp.]
MNEIDILRAMNGIDEGLLDTREVIARSRGVRARRTAAVAAAACAALTMTVTAGAAVYRAYHSESEERYISGAEALPEGEGAVMENEHLRLTVDNVLSDGKTPLLILTAEAKDSRGAEFFEDGPKVYFEGSLAAVGELYRREGDAPDVYAYICELDVPEGLGSAELEFKGGGETFTARLSLEKNLETAEFVSKDGRSITLSPIGAYLGEGFTLATGESSVLGDMQLVYSDGRAKAVPHSSTAVIHGGYETADGSTEVEFERRFFGTVIDIGGVDALFVQGTEFSRR